jgi:hypothetical protein
LFPELKPYLQEAWEAAEPGAVYVISSIRDDAKNLRTPLERIIYRAGLIPWPLWQNLRSSRETELTERFPIHVVCAWIGNSAAAAAKHYLQVTDEYYQQAIRGVADVLAPGALQNPVQRAHASGGTDSQAPVGLSPTSQPVQRLATPCDNVQMSIVGP